MPAIRNSISSRFFLVFCVIVCGFSQFNANSVNAQNVDSVRLYIDVEIDQVGQIEVRHQLKLPPQQYQMLKRTIRDPFYVIRSMQSNSSWLELSDIEARFDDGNHQVVTRCDAVGTMRTLAPGRWMLPIGQDSDGFELLDLTNQHAVFGVVTESPFGIVRAYFRIHFPPTAEQVHFDKKFGNLTYQLEPNLEYGDSPNVDYEIQVQEQIMSSLASVYGDEESMLFAAKKIFTNTGDQKLYNYRVRFRVDGYSSWSTWKRCKVVYPGQSVLDYFYPVFDIDRLTKLTGTRRAMIRTEYEYTTEEGEKVTDGDARRVQILSRNEVVFSRRVNANNLNWFEQFELIPQIVTCFTNGTDPVMQQFAGRVSSLAGGPASAYSTNDAIRYLRTVWLAMEANRIAYQTPPGINVGDHFGQHVKYGRDVLRNRAGTCIDLSVFWASAAESVGLKPYIAVIPGHAFPVIELPNGAQIPIESTMINKSTFDKAVERGAQELQKARQQGLIFFVDIADLKNSQDLGGLDLPELGEDVLTVWGYQLDKLPTKEEAPPKPQQQTAQRTTSQQSEPARDEPQRQTQPQKKYIGKWAMKAQHQGYQFEGVQVFQTDGKYACVLVVTDPNGQKQTQKEVGTYVDRGTHFEFKTNEGNYNQKYSMDSNGDMQMEFPDLGIWIRFRKAD